MFNKFILIFVFFLVLAKTSFCQYSKDLTLLEFERYNDEYYYYFTNSDLDFNAILHSKPLESIPNFEAFLNDLKFDPKIVRVEYDSDNIVTGISIIKDNIRNYISKSIVLDSFKINLPLLQNIREYTNRLNTDSKLKLQIKKLNFEYENSKKNKSFLNLISIEDLNAAVSDINRVFICRDYCCPETRDPETLKINYYDMTDNCEQRAAYLHYLLEKKGISSQKIFIGGILNLDRKKQNFWYSHVANLIIVSKNKNEELYYVLDFAISEKILTLEDWKTKLTDGECLRLDQSIITPCKCPGYIYCFTGKASLLDLVPLHFDHTKLQCDCLKDDQHYETRLSYENIDTIRAKIQKLNCRPSH